MGLFENLLCKYSSYNEIVLLVCNIIFGMGVIVGAILLKDRIRNVINTIMHKVFYILMIVSVGNLLRMIGAMPEIEYKYFYIMIFILAVGLVMLYAIFQCITYRKVTIPLLLACKNVEYIILVEIFLLAFSSKLELLECLTGTFAIICVDIAFMLYEKLKCKEEKVVSKESDYENDDLYYTRAKQLEKFIPILEQQKEEPYAIMISGEWGLGKTSFVKALEKKLENDVFIWVRAGSEKSVSEIMIEISEQILEILKDNNILVEKGSLIEKYFLAFSGLLDDSGLNFFSKFASIFVGEESKDSKEYLNGKLKELDKTIYLIIDDLDRCSKEHQANMFKVIIESTELEHCKTMFLVDKTQFLQSDFTEHYIEKYISYTLDLCDVDYVEIMDYYIDNILKEERFSGISNIILKDRSVREIRKDIIDFANSILEVMDKELIESKDNVSELQRKWIVGTEEKERNQQDIEAITNKINDIDKTISEIRKNIRNSRKVKNYLKI